MPRTDVLFDTPRVYTAGVYIPLPRYVVAFGANSHFFENAFPGARADIGLPFNGSAHSLTALHIRNDAFNGTYLAFDQHFVWAQDWIAFGIDPLTQGERQYNLIGYKRWSPKIESRLFLQESAGQPGIITRPDNAAGFAQLQVSGGFRGSNLTYTQDNYYQYLLGIPKGLTDLNTATFTFDPRWKEHPTDGLLTFTGGQTTLVRGTTPLYIRPRAGMGYAHDVYGEGGYPNEQPGPPTLYYHYAGGSVYTPPVKLVAGLSLTGLYDRQRTWFSVPHHVDLGDLRFTAAGAREKQHLRYYLAYEVRTTDDYWGADQLKAYTPYTDTFTSPGVRDVLGARRVPRARDVARLHLVDGLHADADTSSSTCTLSRYYDTPAPVPGFYGQPPCSSRWTCASGSRSQVLLDVSALVLLQLRQRAVDAAVRDPVLAMIVSPSRRAARRRRSRRARGPVVRAEAAARCASPGSCSTCATATSTSPAATRSSSRPRRAEDRRLRHGRADGAAAAARSCSPARSSTPRANKSSSSTSRRSGSPLDAAYARRAATRCRRRSATNVSAGDRRDPASPAKRSRSRSSSPCRRRRRSTSAVYISTDASGWNPQAIKMDRIDGQRYRAVRRFASGTKFAFRVTRGSWNSVELGQRRAASTAARVLHQGGRRAGSARDGVRVVRRPRQRAAGRAAGRHPDAVQPQPVPAGRNLPAARATPPGGFPTPRPGGQPNVPPG